MRYKFYSIYGGYNIGIAVYMLMTGVFMYFLNQLNLDLLELEQQGRTAFDLIQYENYLPVWFFFIAVLLGLTGVVLIVFFGKRGLEEASTIGEVLYGVLICIAFLFLFFWLIKLITIPILRIIFTVVMAGIGILYVMSDSH